MPQLTHGFRNARVAYSIALCVAVLMLLATILIEYLREDTRQLSTPRVAELPVASTPNSTLSRDRVVDTDQSGAGVVDVEPTAAPRNDLTSSLRVLVQSLDGVPIEGATLWTQDRPGGEPQASEVTSATGEARLKVRAGSDLLYSVTHANWCRSTGSVRITSEPSPLVVTLGSGAYVQGRVKVVGGEQPASPITIVAWEDGTSLQRAGSEWPYTRHATTLPDGSFRVGPFPMSSFVRCMAFGDGYVSIDPASGTEAGGDHIALTVAPLYAVVVAVSWGENRDRDGPPLTPANPVPKLSRLHELGLRLVPHGVDVLKCVAPALVDAASSPGDQRTLFRWVLYSNRDEPSLGPVEFTAVFPGFEFVRAEVRATRLTGPTVAVSELTLERRAGVALGTAEIVLDLASRFQSHGVELGRPAYLATVRLEPRVRQDATFAAIDGHLYFPPDERLRMENIPAGEYAVHVNAPGPGDRFQVSPRVVIVRDSEVAQVVVTAPDNSGSLLLNASPHKLGFQMASLRLRWTRPGKGDAVQHLRFEGPPYVVPILEPGTYRLEGSVGGRAVARDGIRVESGAQTRVDLYE